MWLVVGLGNPGARYRATRHNVGFWVADEVARRLKITLDGERFGARVGYGEASGERVVVLEPQGYMNLSGEAVGPAARFWKAPLEQTIVAHDDLDLDLGRVQLKVGGGDGGHNGLKSVMAHLGAGFARVRCGIGRPPPEWDPADFVLAPFRPEEKAAAEEMVVKGADAVLAALEQGVRKAMNKVNRRPKEKKEE